MGGDEFLLEIDINNDKSERINYNIPGIPVFINKLYLEVDYDFAVECHWHDDIEFVLVTSGSLLYNINGECVELKKGEGVFINSKQMHYGFTLGENICECITVIFHPMLLCPHQHFEVNYIIPVITNTNFTYFILSENDSWTADVFEKLTEAERIYSQKKANPELKLQSLFYDIWELLYENMPSANTEAQAYCDYSLSAFKEMAAFIHTHYTEKISLADIAAAGKVCRSKCCALFKKYLQQSPINYLTVHRLRRAAELLADASVNMAEIADISGFAGASYFSETFRRYYGCSPSEYRIKTSGRR